MKWLKWFLNPSGADKLGVPVKTRHDCPKCGSYMTETEPARCFYSSFVKVGNFTKDGRDGKFLGGLGLAGEAGEVADIIKKHLLHGKELDREHLVEELGDVTWYLFHACNAFGISFQEVLNVNVGKLCERYPDQYGPMSDWIPIKGE